ncbi:MAG TPA: RHS repeat-associated core domain-containing protein [Acidobacteriaceae bacterium]|nr:RHS repeat-associated core domain-containing protein [Acidobacteriaceae bacterium]
MNGALSAYIPLLSLPQRGGYSLNLGFVHHSNLYSLQQVTDVETTVATSDGTNVLVDTINYHDSMARNSDPLEINLPRLQFSYEYMGDYSYYISTAFYWGEVFCATNFTFTDWSGNSHPFENITACNTSQAGRVTKLPGNTDASDGSFYRLDTTNLNDLKVLSPDGTTYHFTWASDPQSGNVEDFYGARASSIVDANGNQISIQTGQNGGAPSYTVTDTLGRTIGITSTAISYKDSNGTAQQIAVNTTVSSQTTPFDLGLTCQYNGPQQHPPFVNPTVGTPTSPINYPTQTQTSIVFPASAGGGAKTYLLTFDQDDRLTKIQYPDGGYRRYDYTLISGGSQLMGNVLCSYGVNEVLDKYECSSSSGSCSTEQKTSYAATLANDSGVSFNGTMAVTDPLGDTDTHAYNTTSRTRTNPQETEEVIKGSSGNVLRTIQYQYPNIAPPGAGQYSFDITFPSVVTTTLNDVSPTISTITNNTYEPYTAGPYGNAVVLDNPTEIDTTDYSGSVIRKVSQQWEPASAFTSSPLILDRLQSRTTTDATGNVSSTLTYGYDTSGNVTSEKVSGISAGPFTTYYYRNSYGQITSIVDPLTHPTTIGYADNWSATGGSCVPANDSAYPTSITNALNQTTSYSYNSCSGTIASVTDPNSATTSYTYDALNRVTRVNYPDGGTDVVTYNDAPTATVTSKVLRSGSDYLVTTTTYDGWGRTSEMEEPSSAKVDTSYDALGRVASKSNPYYSSTDPLYGTTNYTYDALNRPTIQTQPDGSKLQWCYNDAASQGQTNCAAHLGSVTGEWVDFTDEAGKHWQRTSDSLGRLTEVIEDAGAANLETDYSYDALNNLLRVDQWGGAHGSVGDRVRTFSYDGLSRLLCSSNPENSTSLCPTTGTTSYTAGTIGYTYDADGNVSSKISLLPNQTGSATLTTSYTYDKLNRLTNVSYTDGLTPSNSYFYDTAPTWLSGQKNLIGRLAYSENSYAGGTSGKATETAYSYDAMGRVLQKWEQTPSLSPNLDTVTSTYDLAGDMTSATTAAGTALTYNYDVDGRVSTITSSLNDAQHPGTLYTFDSVEGYYSSGAMHKGTFGNGLTETQAFNNRLQPCRVDVNSSGTYLSHCASAAPTGDVLDFTLGYNAGSTDNGNVVSWSATGQQVFNRSYGYDHFNRISSMTDSASGQLCKGLSWAVDAWGNVTSQTPTGGSCYSFSASSPGTNNRLAAYSYDAAGNVIYDGTSHYTYDALGRALSVVNNGGTTSYVYNENGERVRKNTSSGWTEYFYGIDGNVQSEWNGSSWANQYVYDGSRLLAIYTNGTTEFIHPDHLGSTRLVTGVSQNIIDNMDYEPYGQQTAGADATTHKFTGKERDSESGNDYFGARYYASTMGRFLSPDWAAKAEPIPYARLDDPQSFNLYTYVQNDPLVRVDADGHIDWEYLKEELEQVFYAKSGIGVGYGAELKFTKYVAAKAEAKIGTETKATVNGERTVAKAEASVGVKLGNKEVNKSISVESQIEKDSKLTIPTTMPKFQCCSTSAGSGSVQGSSSGNDIELGAQVGAFSGAIGVDVDKLKQFGQDVNVQINQEVEDFENKVLPKPFAGSSGG